ncbi:MAG: DUF5979 domain-containing protein, partial [Alkalispirochaeta sp.]
MRGLTRRVNRRLSAAFPEKRVFLQSRTGTAYLVEETAHPDYTTEDASMSGTVDEDGETASFTNIRKTGDLIISKTNDGGDPEDVFDFTVTLDDSPYTGTVSVDGSDTDIENGALSLTGGQTAVISGIRTGTGYEVTESVLPGYTASATSISGVMD